VTLLDLVLFGDPVDHSLSPVIQQAALDATGLEGNYRAIRVDADGFRRGCADLRTGRLHGANVTMPHKRLAAEETDERSPGAERSKSVNTIVVEGSRLIGHSTDISGVQQVWQESGLSEEAPVLVLGAGGAAAAALIGLETHKLSLASRRWASAQRLVEEIDVSVDLVPWGTAVPGAVVVNATPLGMGGEDLPSGVVEESAGLLDMAYRRGNTPAVEAARKLRLPHASGTDLLVAQAVLSFFLWTGLPAPAEQMRAALQKAQATG
jgi:shikimate dehydrogenase